MPEYKQSIPAPLKVPPIAFSEATRESTRPPVGEDFRIPALWIAYGGGLVGLLVVAASVLLCNVAGVRPDVRIVLPLGALFAAISAVSAWLFFVDQMWGGLGAFLTTETIKGPVVEPSVPALLPAQTVRVEFHDTTGGGSAYAFADLPAGMIEIARGVAVGRPFSEEEWTGRNRPFSVAEFWALRGRLMELKWLRWKNEREHSQGTDFSLAGRAVLRRLAEMSGPLPYQDGRQEVVETLPVRAYARVRAGDEERDLT